MNVKEASLWGAKELKKNGVSEPEKSADFLLREVLGWDKAELYAHFEKELSVRQEEKFKEHIKKRSLHQPVWYITGKIEFYGLTFSVNENVLIPRPETEFLVERVFDNMSKVKCKTSPPEADQPLAEKLKTKESKSTIPNTQYPIPNTVYRILDIGTGSGAIALAIANEVKSKPSSAKRLRAGRQITDSSKIKVCASDVSVGALEVAKINAKDLGLEKDVEFRRGSLLDPWKGEKFDIIVANLPYIPHEDMSGLALDIHHWEPRLALDGGPGGLEVYERLLKNIELYLNPNASLYFEIGIDQGKKLEKMVKKHLPGSKVAVSQDYANIDRIVSIEI